MAFLIRQMNLARRALGAVALMLGCILPGGAGAQSSMNNAEKELKVAFIYNFMLFTEWPSEVGNTLNICLTGQDPFGQALDLLGGRLVAGRSLVVHRKNGTDSFGQCQVLFISSSEIGSVQRVLESLGNTPTLTIADSPGAASQGVALNMRVLNNKVTFQANLQAVRSARLNLSSKLLRLATDVIQ